MAFATMLRRTAASAAPLATRLIGKSRHHTSAAILLSSARHGGAVTRRSFFPSAINFSTQPASVSKTDKTLLKLIDSEIDCADEEEEYLGAGDIPENFPFKIEDNEGEQVVKMTRKYEGEKIEVEIYGDGITGDNEYDDDKDNDDKDIQQTPLNLVVKITKNLGPFLEFSCSATPDEIRIDGLFYKNPEDTDDDETAYTGPYFVDLNENLQKAFHNYLTDRGVTVSAMKYMQDYMMNKDSREYKLWLKSLKKFVEA